MGGDCKGCDILNGVLTSLEMSDKNDVTMS